MAIQAAAPRARLIFAGDEARALRMDGDGYILRVEYIEGNGGALNVVAALEDLIRAEELDGALADIRSVMETGAARFVTWTITEGEEPRVHAGWLYPESRGFAVGVLRGFDTALDSSSVAAA
jgi:hypothetical protein